MLFGQVLQIACSSGLRRAGDGHIFLGAHAALKVLVAILQYVAQPLVYRVVGRIKAASEACSRFP